MRGWFASATSGSERSESALRVLVTPDKFKGTLTAGEAARAIAVGWRGVRPHDELDLLPMTDGGDGFGRIVGSLMGARTRRAATRDAAGRPARARWWWVPEGRMAIVESAEVVGLARLPPGRFHPFDLDTRGLGRLLAAVAREEPRRTFVGVGGSATNDGGFGLALALGWRFLSRSGSEIERWTQLGDCARIEPPGERLDLGRLSVALDVQNPLLGPKGCTQVFGPQKGIRPEEFGKAERPLRRLSTVMGRAQGRSLAGVPGAGAAGGLGFGLMAFLGAGPRTGFSLFARAAQLEARVRRADLVITGEGRLDDQSLMGKGVGELAALCAEVGVPGVAVVGSSRVGRRTLESFVQVYSMSSLASEENALGRPRYWLARASERAASDWIHQVRSTSRAVPRGGV